MNIHKNARLTPHGRELSGSADSERADAGGRRTSRRRLPANGAQVGGALPGRGRRGPAGSLIAAASAAQADAGSDCREGRSPAPPALDRQADRRRTRHLAGDRQPHPQAPRPQSHRGARAGRAGPPLRAGAARRADPHRHQEARPLRARRPSHHRRSRRQGKSRGAGWEFVHVCIDDASRLAFSQILPDERKESAVAFLKAAVAYYASLGVTWRG